MTETALITPRRNFLIRALGFTAAGATLAVPVIALDSAEQRLMHHMRGAEAAMRELFPTAHVELKGNCLNGHHHIYNELLAQGDRVWATAMITAGQRQQVIFGGANV